MTHDSGTDWEGFKLCLKRGDTAKLWASELYASLGSEMNPLKCIYSNATIKGSTLDPIAIFSLFFSLAFLCLSVSSIFPFCLLSLPQLWTTHEVGPTQDLTLVVFAFFPWFAWSKHSYKLLLSTPFWILLWKWRACVMVYCGLWVSPLRSFLWELKTYWGVRYKM